MDALLELRIRGFKLVLNGERIVCNSPKGLMTNGVRHFINVNRPAIFIALLNETKPTEWLIDGIIPKNGISNFYGEAGSAKSLTALDWAFCAANGHNWHGHEVKRPQRVVVYTDERSSCIGRRLHALTEKYASDLTPKAGGSLGFIDARENNFDNLMTALYGHGCEFLIIDINSVEPIGVSRLNQVIGKMSILIVDFEPSQFIKHQHQIERGNNRVFELALHDADDVRTFRVVSRDDESGGVLVDF